MSEKIYDVPAEWAKRAWVDQAKYKEMYARSIADPNAFWAEQAKRIDWMHAPTKIENVSFAPGNISIKWFEDGILNVAHNCIDRHLAQARRPDRDHLGRRRSLAVEAHHLQASCTTKSAGWPTSCAPATSRRATASPSICR